MKKAKNIVTCAIKTSAMVVLQSVGWLQLLQSCSGVWTSSCCWRLEPPVGVVGRAGCWFHLVHLHLHVSLMLAILPKHRLHQRSPNFFSEGHIRYNTAVRGPDILHNVIVSGYVTFFVSILAKWLLGPDGMASRAGSSPRAVVWRPLVQSKA